MKRLHVRQYIFGAVLVGGGIIAGTWVSTSNVAHGEVRTTPQPAAFQSGGQMSVPILQNIAGTLQQIDARLARLEIVAQRLQSPKRTAGDAATETN